MHCISSDGTMRNGVWQVQLCPSSNFCVVYDSSVQSTILIGSDNIHREAYIWISYTISSIFVAAASVLCSCLFLGRVPKFGSWEK